MAGAAPDQPFSKRVIQLQTDFARARIGGSEPLATRKSVRDVVLVGQVATVDAEPQAVPNEKVTRTGVKGAVRRLHETVRDSLLDLGHLAVVGTGTDEVGAQRMELQQDAVAHE